MNKKLALLLSLGLCAATMAASLGIAADAEEATYKSRRLPADGARRTGCCLHRDFVEGLKEAGYEEGKNRGEFDMTQCFQGEPVQLLPPSLPMAEKLTRLRP